MTAQTFVEQQYMVCLPPGASLPWTRVTEARYTHRGRYPRAEASVELWDGTRARLAVEGTPDWPSMQWLELPRPFEWTGSEWAWDVEGGN